ncbi:chaperone protein dnaJ 72 [Canna indica]|uniref:Chaperone protein dnaJ 72 n=1 Tax=Canna indica TaxID=4628 RepID=A0AAQ3KE97_9LILI|nr:chaperone protein dnaJ 72 [Canna indica]
MDHYKTLALNRNATKEEIKEAFRRSALKFHPDRHSQSSNEVREGASLKFKQASEAYEVLVDDRKRANYDRAWRVGTSDRWSRGASSSSSSSSYSYSSQYHRGNHHNYGYRRPPARDGALGLDLEMLLRLLTRRGFLVGMVFASALVGGAVFVENSVENIWKMNNSGKSFEDAIQSIERIKAQKENS